MAAVSKAAVAGPTTMNRKQLTSAQRRILDILAKQVREGHPAPGYGTNTSSVMQALARRGLVRFEERTYYSRFHRAEVTREAAVPTELGMKLADPE